MPTADTPPLIAHVIYRLAIGGLENGVVNLVNHMPRDRYRHVIISMTDATDFERRLERDDVDVYCLGKKSGRDLAVHWRLRKQLRRLRPDIVHTRNLATVEALVTARLSGVRARVHGEHGWDTAGPEAVKANHHRLRRWCCPSAGRFIALSSELADYLVEWIGIPRDRIAQIINGVDTKKFSPANDGPIPLTNVSMSGDKDTVVLGTVGRLQEVKDQINLVRALRILVKERADLRARVRLLIVGDGPLRGAVEKEIEEGRLGDIIHLAGARDDVPAVLRALDVFVLPSRAEGISNTILEAMASGLPVCATKVGGNSELVVDNASGRLAPPESPEALAQAIVPYVEDRELRRTHGAAGRARVVERFSLEAMVARYLDVYDLALVL